MPKVGMEPMRRQQLIDATIDVVAEVGLKSATINLISRRAGMSSGIISHYFGGKQALIEASVRYLLTQLKMVESSQTPHERLMKIVDLNFSDLQQADASTKTWLSFWGQSMHDPDLYRLQELNKRRLVSNLRYSFKQLLPADKASQAAEVTAALIDGFWLRCALSRANHEKFSDAKAHCKHYINDVLKQHGIT
ncbi:transcriptional regulator BetI [Alteromonas sp. A079]|uniref:transcriptional regulator BetI n=1 Tax=Alteromonas sp. A079 TaxID=3410268 RepID=UPI003B9E512A